MKRCLLFILLFSLTFTTAVAEQSWEFHDTYYKNGIDAAVVQALKEKYTPDGIMKTALPIEELSRPELIRALYCALVPPDDIEDAAEINALTEEQVKAGYELALAQCACRMEKKWNIAAAEPTGVDKMVIEALSTGLPPEQIIRDALLEAAYEPEILIKALYCALVPPAYIRDAAEANSITEEKIALGYQLALAQCACAMEEKEISPPVQFSGNSTPPSNRTINAASPSTF